MTTLHTALLKIYDKMSGEIKAVRASGKVAPDGVNIVPYVVMRDGIRYEYYKLVAPEPMFEGKNGKKTKTKHLGDYRSQKYKEAVLPIERRKAIKILESQQAKIREIMMQPWHFIERVKRSRN